MILLFDTLHVCSLFVHQSIWSMNMCCCTFFNAGGGDNQSLLLLLLLFVAASKKFQSQNWYSCTIFGEGKRFCGCVWSNFLKIISFTSILWFLQLFRHWFYLLLLMGVGLMWIPNQFPPLNDWCKDKSKIARKITNWNTIQLDCRVNFKFNCSSYNKGFLLTVLVFHCISIQHHQSSVAWYSY